MKRFRLICLVILTLISFGSLIVSVASWTTAWDWSGVEPPWRAIRVKRGALTFLYSNDDWPPGRFLAPFATSYAEAIDLVVAEEPSRLKKYLAPGAPLDNMDEVFYHAYVDTFSRSIVLEALGSDMGNHWFFANFHHDPWQVVSHVNLLVIFALTGVLPFLFGIQVLIRRMQRVREGFCRICKYDLTGNVTDVCPECGTFIEEDVSRSGSAMLALRSLLGGHKNTARRVHRRTATKRVRLTCLMFLALISLSSLMVSFAFWATPLNWSIKRPPWSALRIEHGKVTFLFADGKLPPSKSLVPFSANYARNTEAWIEYDRQASIMHPAFVHMISTAVFAKSSVVEFLARDMDNRWFFINVHHNPWQIILHVNLFAAAALTGLLPLIIGVRGIIRRNGRIPEGCCRKCAYDLTGNTSGVCPECGTETSESE